MDFYQKDNFTGYFYFLQGIYKNHWRKILDLYISSLYISSVHILDNSTMYLKITIFFFFTIYFSYAPRRWSRKTWWPINEVSNFTLRLMITKRNIFIKFSTFSLLKHVLSFEFLSETNVSSRMQVLFRQSCWIMFDSIISLVQELLYIQTLQIFQKIKLLNSIKFYQIILHFIFVYLIHLNILKYLIWKTIFNNLNYFRKIQE